MAKRKKHKNRQAPAVMPPTMGIRIPMAQPTLVNIGAIKDEATQQAVRILQKKVELSDQERERIRKEAYDQALSDALRYILTCGSKALNNKYRFAYKRLERYIDETMRLIQEGDIEEMTAWLAKVGFTFNFGDKKQEEQNNGNS